MRLSISRDSKLQTIKPRVQLADIPPHHSATLDLYHVACKLSLIFHSAENRRGHWRRRA